MLNKFKSTTLGRKLGLAACTYGLLFQLGACIPSEISTSTTVTARDFLLTILRTLLIQPIDTALTNAVDNALDEDE